MHSRTMSAIKLAMAGRYLGMVALISSILSLLILYIRSKNVLDLQ